MEVISIYAVFRAAHSFISQFPVHGWPNDVCGSERDAAWTHAEGGNWLLQLQHENTRGRKYHFHPLQSKAQQPVKPFQNKSMKASAFGYT